MILAVSVRAAGGLSMSNPNARQNALGVFWLIYGVICLVKAAWVILNAAVLTLMWGALLNRVPNPFFWMSVFHFFLLAAVILTIITGVVSFLAGMSLMGRGGSGRTLAIVAGFLGLLTGPLGIALGVYTLILFVPRAAAGNEHSSAAS
jgi:hypothetical protein